LRPLNRRGKIPGRLQVGRRAASKGEAENNTSKMWYGEAGCLELLPKRNIFSKGLMK